MSDGCREQLGWKISADLWARYKRHVNSEWGGTSPYTGIQIEQSWREYHADGNRHTLEEVSQKIVTATGRSQNATREKSPRTRINANAETTTVWVRVHEDVKKEMAALADESNAPKRAVLRAVLTWYVDGGRDDLILEKLERVVDDIEAAFETLDGTSTSLSKAERRTRAIAAQLGEAFNEEDLAKAINAETSGTDYFHDEYTPRVIQYKGVKRVQKEDKADIFLPPQKWQTRKVSKIITKLDGDTLKDTAPPFSRSDFAQAASQVGFNRTDTSTDTINTYLDLVLDRLDFHWNDASGQFEPTSRAEDESSPSENSNSGTGAID
jgi:hypothetical protein